MTSIEIKINGKKLVRTVQAPFFFLNKKNVTFSSLELTLCKRIGILLYFKGEGIRKKKKIKFFVLTNWFYDVCVFFIVILKAFLFICFA